MNSGKILLIIFLVISTVIGFATIQDYTSDENESLNVDDFSSQVETVKVKISDGVGSLDYGKWFWKFLIQSQIYNDKCSYFAKSFWDLV